LTEMQTNISRDERDGSNWIVVDCHAKESQLDLDRVLLLELIARKHGVNCNKSVPSETMKKGEFYDSQTVYIENPTTSFEKDFLLWTLGKTL